eukprot:TRINITY_DN24163_c0_g1_i1.p1 TRINITY_DN24163_c0_g1~~TRINITY_DN24163_c0_g1_i1.p1  ORF type:complete len:123 (+),score=24.73 TRINITY_DN24163_c0_g1_i1:80-448(+)
MSWKQNFKPHVVAANMGTTDKNFVYHREMESFPAPMSAPLRVRKRAPTPLSKLSGKARALKNYFLPGGNRGLVGIGFGLAMPLAGFLVLYSFVASADHHTTQELYELQLQKQKAREQKAAEV